MKYRSYIFLFLLTGVASFLSGFKKNDCGGTEMIETAVGQLKKFNLIQSFPFYMKKRRGSAEIEYKKQVITLSRGIRYKFFAVRNTEYDGVPILSIYNNEKQEILLGSTYNATFKRFYNELEFECKTTGNYCLSFYFLDGLEGCGLGVFSSMIKE